MDVDSDWADEMGVDDEDSGGEDSVSRISLIRLVRRNMKVQRKAQNKIKYIKIIIIQSL